MYKEIIICVAIIIAVFFLDIFSQKYTEDSLKSINEELVVLKESIVYEKQDEPNKQTYNIIDEWSKRYEFLAFYIEHDELEKVKTELVSLRANIETGELEQAIGDIDRSIFLLEHIKQKMSLQIKNIF